MGARFTPTFRPHNALKFRFQPPMHSTLRILTRLIALAFLCAAQGVLAAPVCPTQPITFAFFESGLMYSDQTKDGIDKAVMQELARRSGCTFEFALKPRTRIWRELAHGDLMMTGSALRTNERDAYAWAVNYFGLKTELIIRNTHASAPKTREEFLHNTSLKMGVARGFHHSKEMEHFIDALRVQNRIIEGPPRSMFEMLKRDRFAAMPVNPLDVLYRNKIDLSEFTIATDWFPSDKSVPRALLFSKKYFSKTQVHEWHTLVQQMRNDGTLKRIFVQYAGAATAEALMQFPSDAL